MFTRRLSLTHLSLLCVLGFATTNPAQADAQRSSRNRPSFTEGRDQMIVDDAFDYADSAAVAAGGWWFFDGRFSDINPTAVAPPPRERGSIQIDMRHDMSGDHGAHIMYDAVHTWTSNPRTMVVEYWIKVPPRFNWGTQFKVHSIIANNAGNAYYRLPVVVSGFFSCPSERMGFADVSEYVPVGDFQIGNSGAREPRNATVGCGGNGGQSSSYYTQYKESSRATLQISDGRWYKWTFAVRQESAVDRGDGFYAQWVEDESGGVTEILCYDGRRAGANEANRVWTRTSDPTGGRENIKLGPHPQNRGFYANQSMWFGHYRWWEELDEPLACQ